MGLSYWQCHMRKNQPNGILFRGYQNHMDIPTTNMDYKKHCPTPPPMLTEYTIAQLRQQVEHLLHSAKQDPATNHLVEHITSEQVMQQSHARIKQWITTGTAQIKAHIAAAKQRDKIKTWDIQQYLNHTTYRHCWNNAREQTEMSVSGVFQLKNKMRRYYIARVVSAIKSTHYVNSSR